MLSTHAPVAGFAPGRLFRLGAGIVHVPLTRDRPVDHDPFSVVQDLEWLTVHELVRDVVMADTDADRAAAVAQPELEP